MSSLRLTIVNLARRRGLDAEAALRQANAKFRRRFAAMEQIAGGGATALANRSLGDLDELWRQAKELEVDVVADR
jgi:nucleoside triphosphate diphosphatase